MPISNCILWTGQALAEVMVTSVVRKQSISSEWLPDLGHADGDSGAGVVANEQKQPRGRNLRTCRCQNMVLAGPDGESRRTLGGSIVQEFGGICTTP